MVQIVNGYTCSNPAQVALAKRGIDPAAGKQAAGTQIATAQAVSATQAPAPTSQTGRGRFIDLLT